MPPVWTVDAAVRYALENNPELAAVRQQHGIAAAGVVIAQTYPFNPIWEGKIRATTGPESAGITNAVSNEHKFLVDVEIRGQRKYRRQGADAALSRVDWEIAFQEVNLANRVVRAFYAVVYRNEKLALVAEIIQLNEKAAEHVRKLVDQARLKPADLVLIGTEVDDARGQEGPAQTSLAMAGYDLRRALGLIRQDLTVQGKLQAPPFPEDHETLVNKALELRPDLHARQAAVQEAEARLQLEIRNRYGNPNIGPAYEYDPTRVNLIGAQITLPLPLFNTHRGEIMQRSAERGKAGLELHQTEVQVRQDVEAALARLEKARAWANNYEKQIIPNFRSSLERIERLFDLDPTVDVLRIIEIRRKLLKARDTYLDALWEVTLAQADLAAALGDPSIIISH
jgi:cobalt-zinc-cadmium efflux system outer membrane protein